MLRIDTDVLEELNVKCKQIGEQVDIVSCVVPSASRLPLAQHAHDTPLAQSKHTAN